MDGWDGRDAGMWLVRQRADLDRGEAEWLERLAQFDREGLWALDGHLCCGTWLVCHTNMARSTAFEKLRVAHELDRRPIVAGAFRRGDLSYSAVRAILRMERPDPEVDQALVDLARSGRASISDLERVVRSYRLYADQEREPTGEPPPVRHVSIRRGDEGTGQVVIAMSDLELEEFAAALQVFVDRRYRTGPGDGSSAADSAVPEAPLEEADRGARRADAFMDMVSAGLAGAEGGSAVGDDRYMVHLVTRDGRSFARLNGDPLHPRVAATVACDCSTVTHVVGDRGEPLRLGRRTRQWTPAQRRAVSVRDGGHCRFPGCDHAHFDIHHLRAWEIGGSTDVGNGVCECRRHHRMLHAGYRVEGDPAGELRFHRPDGTYIGSTYPAVARILGRPLQEGEVASATSLT